MVGFVQPTDNVVDLMDKRKMADVPLNIGELSLPTKKSKDNHGVVHRSTIPGKSMAIIQSLLSSSMLNCVRGVDPLPTVPFVSSSVSATSECEVEAEAEASSGAHLGPIGPVERFVILLDSSSHFGAYDTEVDSFSRSLAPLPSVGIVAAPSVNLVSSSKKRKKKEKASINPFGRIHTIMDVEPHCLSETYVLD